MTRLIVLYMINDNFSLHMTSSIIHYVLVLAPFLLPFPLHCVGRFMVGSKGPEEN